MSNAKMASFIGPPANGDSQKLRPISMVAISKCNFSEVIPVLHNRAQCSDYRVIS